jgi:prolyl oligopeptidase
VIAGFRSGFVLGLVTCALWSVGASVETRQAVSQAAAPVAAPPAAERRPVRDSYNGLEVVDEYRWLENWDDPAVKAWSAGQSTYARSVLDALPRRDAIRARLRQLTGGSRGFSSLSYRNGTLFALETEPPKQQPFLVTIPDANDPASARVIVDPAAIDPKGGLAIDWYVASPDGAFVAASLSAGGSERGDVHTYDVKTAARTGEIVPRVNGGTAGGSLCWTPDGSGFYYTRYPAPGERPDQDLDFYLQVYFHARGTPAAQDRYELGKDFPRIAEIQLACSAGGYVAANVQNGDGGGFAQYLRSPAGRWTRLTSFGDGVDSAFFGAPGAWQDDVFFVSHAGAPRGQILRLHLDPARAPRIADATPIVPERADAVIDFDFYGARGVVTTATRLFTIDLIGGPNQVRVFDQRGRLVSTLPLPRVSALNELVPIGGDRILYKVTTYTEPSTWYELDLSRGTPGIQPARRGISTRSSIDLSNMVVSREVATSKDGTKVPLTVVRHKGTPLDGRNPTLLTGYGGYGLSQRPYFLGNRMVWLEQGGVFAIANLRGGGEFGEAWHRAGRLIQKQNVFDDFIACAEHLVRARYTSAARLAIEGGSNGGLLMGAAMTQRPDLFRAVVSHVGIYDMLRVELSPNGSFNVPEFGTVKNGDQFRAMRAYSPYHRVRDHVSYPPTLFLTGANDPRVDPMHSRKMTARLQAAMDGEGTVLLRTSGSTGHGIGTPLDEAIEQSTDVYAFLFKQLGVEYRPR